MQPDATAPATAAKHSDGELTAFPASVCAIRRPLVGLDCPPARLVFVWQMQEPVPLDLRAVHHQSAETV